MKLPEFLCTSPARLGELTERIGAASAGRFTRTRPHGVLIARIAAIGAGVLEPVSGSAIPVRGRLAVFAERADDGSATRTARAARAPYLAACVLGRASPGAGEPVEVLSAYAHPCASERHLMLVDSDLERQTLAQLRSVQDWLGSRKGLRVVIEKPLFDIGPDDTGVREAVPRPPCIPDFMVRATTADGAPARVVIVETMGFADEAYRARKRHTHALMRAALAGATVVVHDFHEPRGVLQSWRAKRFWDDLRCALTER